jgi:uncharacterized membrane protein (DUF373 family)
MESMLTRAQKLIANVLAILLVVVVALATIDLVVLIGHEIWRPPKFLIAVQGLLEIFSFFLLILIGVELIETAKAYLSKDVVHLRLVLEVALIAMARKVIILEPSSTTGLTLFGMAALIVALSLAFYVERKVHGEPGSASNL